MVVPMEVQQMEGQVACPGARQWRNQHQGQKEYQDHLEAHQR